MSDKPAYLETWAFYSYEGPRNRPGATIRLHGASVCSDSDPLVEDHECIATAFSRTDETQACDRARLAASAPALVRALLECEWTDSYQYDCSANCGGGTHAHAADCTINSALTAAGFPDQASRDEARRRMGAK